MPNLGLYVRRALELPPHVAARKAAGLALRSSRRLAQKVRDRVIASYGPPIDGELGLSIALAPEIVGEAERAALAALAPLHLAHRIDILGSGYVEAGYGAEAPGIDGARYETTDEARAMRTERAPWRLLPRACQRRARSIFALIDDPSYQPIDWQRDMRSGYRWSACTPWQDLRVGRDRGADIKMPWELARAQHLPQLAMCAILAGAGDPRFASREDYVREVRNVILDFLAANPPRYGACWGCPMDVGIRAANWVLACALLQGAGIRFDAAFLRELLAGLRDAAAFISANLEWAETGRSNHYLSDLTGLLFAAAALPRSPETGTWINFAARELCNETVVQFHADGGNYEGSTSYHRLAGELVVYGLALACGLAGASREAFDTTDPATLSAMRVPMPPAIEPIAPALARAGERLAPMLAFTRAIQRPDGDIVQIGDTDSGRLFKLMPVLRWEADGAGPAEAHLRVHELIHALETLTGAAKPGKNPVCQIVAALAGGHVLRPASHTIAGSPAVAPEPAHEADLIARLRAEIETLPPGSRRVTRLALPQPIDGPPALSAFPDFGLYCLATTNLFLAFRAARHHRTDAPSGHTHDDNLGLELVAGGVALVTDPGTYVYTSFPEHRNAYRGWRAHFVPRAAEFPVVNATSYLFELEHLLSARCLLASPRAIAGVLEGSAGRILRLIEVDRDAVTVRDGVVGGTLLALEPPVTIAIGYGKKTTRTAFAV